MVKKYLLSYYFSFFFLNSLPLVKCPCKIWASIISMNHMWCSYRNVCLLCPTSLFFTRLGCSFFRKELPIFHMLPTLFIQNSRSKFQSGTRGKFEMIYDEIYIYLNAMMITCNLVSKTNRMCLNSMNWTIG